MENNFDYDQFTERNPFMLKLTGEELRQLIELLNSSIGELPANLNQVRVDIVTHLFLCREQNGEN